jgi:hypothetical protein
MLEPFVLEGVGVRLEPLAAGHAAALAAAATQLTGTRRQDLDPDQQLAPVGCVDHRPAVQRAQQQRHELGQRDQPDVKGGTSEPVDLIRDGDGGQLRPEQGDQLAAEQDAQITGLPQGRDVNEDPSLRHCHLR